MFILNIKNTETNEKINLEFKDDSDLNETIVIFKTILIWMTFSEDQVKEVFDKDYKEGE